MELIKDTVTVGEVLLSQCFSAIADGDMIVPDTKPDILKILQVDASACVSSKEIREGKLFVSGKTELTVLYLPDCEEPAVQSIKTSFDFSHKADNPQFDRDSFAIIASDVSKVDFHVINSRKLSLRAEILMDCQVIAKKDSEFVTGIEDENAQMKMQNITVNSLCGIRDEEFMIKEALEIPTGKASISEILKIDYKLCHKEYKAITEKIVTKGTLDVCILYTDDMGSIEYTEAEIPFTEVFDFPDLNEDMDCELNYRICDSYFAPAQDSDGDMRIVNIELLVCAEMKAGEKKELEIIKDFYCPGKETNINYKEIILNETVASPVCQNTIRESAVIDKDLPKVQSVYNVVSSAVVTKASPQDNRLCAEGRIDVYILYLTDDEQVPLYSFKKEIPFSYLLDAEGAKEGMACSVSAEVCHTSFHLNAANEVEIRCALNISGNVYSKTTLSVIESAENTPIPDHKKKGIVIYFVQPGETLWDIAKGYSVSREEIAEFNSLEQETVTTGQRLVIPPCINE